MTRFAITVEPRSSLFVGGYTHAAGDSDGDTAADARGALIPGSVLKGALRESAVRLVNAAGRGQDVLERLFGHEEKDAGVIRVGALHAVDPEGDDRPAAALSVRHHVSLERATRQAAPGRLFSNRVTPAGYGLRFRGELRTLQELKDDELGLLASAVHITDQIGGGRGRGLGLVETRIEEIEDRPEPVDLDLPAGRSTVILVLEAREPLQLGVVKDPSNVSPTKGYLDGSAVRGAVAAALGGQGAETLELVFGGDAPAAFGDGRPGNVSAVPAPMTLREPKGGGAAIDDAVRLCAGVVGRRRFDTRAVTGTFAPDARGWTRVKLKQRIVTRTARDHRVGRAAEGKLFSLEVIDPVVETPADAHRRLRFFVPVTGTAEQLRWIARGAGEGLLVGGTRSRGFGRLSFEGVERDSGLPDLEERHRRWARAVESEGGADGSTTGVLVAVGPLAVNQVRLRRALESRELELVDGVSRRRAHGGWNGAARIERTVSGHFLPGSTFIVRARGGSALEALAGLERDGLGPGRADGWGRVVACHPIHVDCRKED